MAESWQICWHQVWLREPNSSGVVTLVHSCDILHTFCDTCSDRHFSPKDHKKSQSADAEGFPNPWVLSRWPEDHLATGNVVRRTDDEAADEVLAVHSGGVEQFGSRPRRRRRREALEDPEGNAEGSWRRRKQLKSPKPQAAPEPWTKLRQQRLKQECNSWKHRLTTRCRSTPNSRQPHSSRT